MKRKKKPEPIIKLGWNKRALYRKALLCASIVAALVLPPFLKESQLWLIVAGVVALPFAIFALRFLWLLLPWYGLTLTRRGFHFRGLGYLHEFRWKEIAHAGVYHLGYFGQSVQITYPKKVSRSSEDFKKLMAEESFLALPPHWRKNDRPNAIYLPALQGFEPERLAMLINAWKQVIAERRKPDAQRMLKRIGEKEFYLLVRPDSRRFLKISKKPFFPAFLLALGSLLVSVTLILPQFLQGHSPGMLVLSLVAYGTLALVLFFTAFKRTNLYIDRRKLSVIEEQKLLFFTLSRRKVVDEAFRISLQEYFDEKLWFYPVVVTGATGKCNLGSHFTKRGAFLFLESLRQELDHSGLRMKMPLGFMDGESHKRTPLWKALELSAAGLWMFLPLIGLACTVERLYRIYLHIHPPI